MQKWENVSVHGDLFHVIAANNTGGYRINFSNDGLHFTFFHIHKMFEARQAGNSMRVKMKRENNIFFIEFFFFKKK